MEKQLDLTIQECSRFDSEIITSILQDAFTPVATEFKLTKINCPTHTSFIRRENIEWEISHESNYYLGYVNEKKDIACISIKLVSNCEAEIKRLGVRPSFQGRGIGKRLVNFVENKCKNNNVKKIKLGMIAKHKKLHEFYLNLGYKEVGTDCFPHLPFQVLYMEKEL